MVETLSPPREFDAQRDIREFWLMCCDGQPEARQKRILLEANAAGYLSDQDTQIFLNALGLKEA